MGDVKVAKSPIDEQNYEMVSNVPFDTKDDAYGIYNMCYTHLKGATVYKGTDGKFYIVQSKTIRKL